MASNVWAVRGSNSGRCENFSVHQNARTGSGVHPASYSMDNASFLGYTFTFDMRVKSNIVRVIKSRRMRWAGHVARKGEERGVYRVWVGKPEGKTNWET